MRLTIQSKFREKYEMSKDEILRTIHPEVMSKIKAIDEHPFFQAFVTAHEGEGNPEILESENQKISFPRRAIESIKNVVRGVIQAFRGHEAGTNDTKGRKPLGQIVGQTEKEIDGKLSHISIFYHPPGVREEAASFDSCSHEGVWTFKEDGKGGLIAQGLETLQAVGLLKGAETPPALAGSLKIGAVQAQEAPGEGEGQTIPPGEGKGDNMDLSKMNYTELINTIKAEMKARQIFPNQIFSIEDLQADREFSKVFAEAQALKAKETELSKQIEALTGENQGLIREKEKASFAPTFQNVLKEKKLTDSTKKFIEREFSRKEFEDFSVEYIDKFITEQADEYTQILKISGHSEPGEGDIITDLGNIPSGGRSPNGEIDYTDKSQNPIFSDE